jgi:protein phosphatase
MKPASQQDTTQYTGILPGKDVQPPEPVSSRVQVDLAARSDKGKVRPNNEDHYLVVRGERALQTLLTNLPEGRLPERFAEVGYGMLVADGMGGMAGGEVASQMAIITLINLVLNTPDWIMRLGEPQTQEVMERMAERFRRVDAALHEQAQFDPSLTGMGTTLTLAYNLGSDLVLAHVGDSRAYLLRNGELHQLTRDHTMAQALVNLGIIRPEEAATHRLRHVLTNALGVSEGRFKPEVQRVSLIDEDQVLLCTDGLTDMVDDATIGTVLRTTRSAREACQTLVELALANGGRDNVTVVLARYRFPRKD